ncbi:RNA polymerase sigma factor [Yeosuana marina]|uniref:RNA polymerase sigma factor n=1 Tax=Yeosuana marina TaxID=1565536 RepID=UPI0030C7C07F
MEEIIVDNSITDEELVTLIVNNKSSQLFSVIYDRYSHVVYNKCISFVKDTNEAQDLTHDIFVKLFIKLKTFNHKSKFSTWLYSFTYNHCVNYVQRDLNKRKDKFLTTEDINDFSEVYPEIKDEFIYELKSDSLQKSLELMDPNDKMILFMKYQDDMTIEDIQKTLEIGKSAVKMRLSRAKSRLIKIYKTFYYGKSV